MSLLQLQNSYVQNIVCPQALKNNITVDVLRLDVIHPVISGNKWFKLQEYIRDALRQKKSTIATYGGAYSNHILATAAACYEVNLHSIGIIRGEEPLHYSPTLQQAMDFGMKLFFLDRESYRLKKIPKNLEQEDIYFINEGGYGVKGAQGAQKILAHCNEGYYTHICAATGTGTMLAGLIMGSTTLQHCIGVSALKNNYSIEEEIKVLLPEQKRFSILYDYHFGGYAKYNATLIHFMNTFFEQYGIPSDFVYTGKLFYAVWDLLEKGYFEKDSKLLLIHSGGLQGNRSLPKGTLIFPSN